MPPSLLFSLRSSLKPRLDNEFRWLLLIRLNVLTLFLKRALIIVIFCPSYWLTVATYSGSSSLMNSLNWYLALLYCDWYFASSRLNSGQLTRLTGSVVVELLAGHYYWLLASGLTHSVSSSIAALNGVRFCHVGFTLIYTRTGSTQRNKRPTT